MSYNEFEIRRLRVTSFFEGMKAGVRNFAHWKNGSQFVGTCGKTLADALKEIEIEEHQYLENINREEGSVDV